jgi:hypothetical protein
MWRKQQLEIHCCVLKRVALRNQSATNNDGQKRTDNASMDNII